MSTNTEINVGGYVASIINGYQPFAGNITVVRERRNGSGTIVTLALDASGAAIVRNILTARINGAVGDHSKDQKRQFSKVVAALPTFDPPIAVVAPEIADAFGMRDLPNVVVLQEFDARLAEIEPDGPVAFALAQDETPAPAPAAPMIEATIEAEIVPAASEGSAPVIDAELVMIKVRTTLRLFWGRIPSLRGADIFQVATEVTDRLLALGAESREIAACLVRGGDIFNTLVVRTARDIGDKRPRPVAKQKPPRAVKPGTVTLGAIGKAEAAEERLKLALATDPKARNIAALKAVATKLRREATQTGQAPLYQTAL